MGARPSDHEAFEDSQEPRIEEELARSRRDRGESVKAALRRFPPRLRGSAAPRARTLLPIGGSSAAGQERVTRGHFVALVRAMLVPLPIHVAGTLPSNSYTDPATTGGVWFYWVEAE